jgi:AraC family transcriptional regulator, regulatory protein of adaptative response / methylated-DNA-[protein]-cysteine methyltransferase
MHLATQKMERSDGVMTDPRWASVVARNPAADGKFYYSVKTTGVYCRPSCAARLARPENVQFHLTLEAAEKAGFRPCKRCKPNQPSLREEHAATITKICRRIEMSEELPRLSKLAAEAGMSVFHFHRVFKAVTGLTPNAYAKANMAKRVRAKLGESSSVTEAIYDSGFNSNSRFYETSNQLLGMTPSEFRAGGSDTDIFFAIGECSLGSILVATSKKGVCAILLGGDPTKLVRDLQDQFPQANLIGNQKQYEAMVAKVVGFVEQPRLGLDLPLDIRGTAFQQRVWKALREIPAGKTASYAQIAKKIGVPKSVRAVAGACASNSLAVAIPCHRVVRTNGSHSGYRWGVQRKRTLLQREARA